MSGLFKTKYGDSKMDNCGDKKSYSHLLKAVRGKLAMGEDEGDFGEGGEESPADVAQDAAEGVMEGSGEDMEADAAMAMNAGDDGEVGGEGDDAMQQILAKIQASNDPGPKRVGMRMGGAPEPEANFMRKSEGKRRV